MVWPAAGPLAVLVASPGGRSEVAYQRTRKRSGSGSPITMRAAEDSAKDVEYAAAESIAGAEEEEEMCSSMFRFVLTWRCEDSNLPARAMTGAGPHPPSVVGRGGGGAVEGTTYPEEPTPHRRCRSRRPRGVVRRRQRDARARDTTWASRGGCRIRRGGTSRPKPRRWCS